MDDSKFVLLGEFTPEEAQNIAGTWDYFKQNPPINGLVQYMYAQKKRLGEKTSVHLTSKNFYQIKSNSPNPSPIIFGAIHFVLDKSILFMIY